MLKSLRSIRRTTCDRLFASVLVKMLARQVSAVRVLTPRASAIDALVCPLARPARTRCSIGESASRRFLSRIFSSARELAPGVTAALTASSNLLASNGFGIKSMAPDLIDSAAKPTKAYPLPINGSKLRRHTCLTTIFASRLHSWHSSVRMS